MRHPTVQLGNSIDSPWLPRKNRPVKILVISMAGIGDTLLATPLIRELRANFPAAVIEALVLSDLFQKR